jgi:hypothetical protein
MGYVRVAESSTERSATKASLARAAADAMPVALTAMRHAAISAHAVLMLARSFLMSCTQESLFSKSRASLSRLAFGREGFAGKFQLVTRLDSGDHGFDPPCGKAVYACEISVRTF